VAPNATAGTPPQEPTPWRFPTFGLAMRIFLTTWLVYSIHFATNIVREIYPAVALADHFSFRVDEYGGMNPDLFETPGRGWHIGNNPGVSFLAAIPYALAKPVIDPLVAHVNAKRADLPPPEYDAPRAADRRFFVKAWQRGLDVKLGLAAFVTAVFCMAPMSALGVVAMFYLLRYLFRSDRTAVWLALLYAFGTPVFYRAGYLNHNMLLGHFAFIGFLAIWNPWGRAAPSERTRYLIGGLTAGNALLYDYSGVVILGGLFFYALLKRYRERTARETIRLGAWFVLGSIPPVLVLWFYQWRAFGNPFLPGQAWMPPVEWIDVGYQGFGFPVPELLLDLLVHIQYGLFVTAPIFLLVLAAPFVNRGRRRMLPDLELRFILLLGVALWLFCGCINYTRLQYISGMRYLAPVVPFLFVAAVIVLMRLRPLAIYLISLLSVTLTWSLSMYRYVDHPLGVLDPVIRTFTHGLALPALTTLSRTSGQYGDYFSQGVSPIPIFLVVGALVYALWSRRLYERVVDRVESRREPRA
jgi:hypothetical protein